MKKPFQKKSEKRASEEVKTEETSLTNIDYNKNKLIKKGVNNGNNGESLWIIDDTYNANPVSFRSAIETLVSFKTTGRRIVVCADMLELGEKSTLLHKRMGRELAGSAINAVFAYGHQSKYLIESLKQLNNNVIAFHSTTLGPLHQKIKQYCRKGDVVLVKGSRGMHLERTIRFFREKRGDN